MTKVSGVCLLSSGVAENPTRVPQNPLTTRPAAVVLRNSRLFRLIDTSAEPRFNAVIVVSALIPIGVLIAVNQRIHGHYVTSGFYKSPDSDSILFGAMREVTLPRGGGLAAPEARESIQIIGAART